MTRRALLASGAALAGCNARDSKSWEGGWVADAPARGHRLRDANVPPAPSSVPRRASLVIVGAGIAGLAAARAAMRAGIDDIALIELHDAPGGNSRGHILAGVPCPLGAHYLPLPGREAHEVSDWLHEIGLLKHELGRGVADERYLCHAPQERLFFEGAWHEGLLPPCDPGSSTQRQYERFAQALRRQQQALEFALPTRRAPWSADHAALDAKTFAQWLSAQGLDDARLRWYLDYCCRDDYGAGIDSVSAWAGLHYFASRHGFRAPGEGDGAERDAVLTWPQGNAWLVERLAAPLGARWQPARVALRLTVERHGVSLDAWDDREQRLERWNAEQAIVATPLFVAARLIDAPPAALRDAAARQRHAPWLVANLHLRAPLLDRLGAAPAWDNVSYGSLGLGYVDAQHQSLSPTPGPTVLTAYHALAAEERGALLTKPWQHWAARVVDDLAATHPDLPAKLVRIDLARHGHAMSIPAPGVRGDAALRMLAEGDALARVRFAHSDLAGYSVFEEAFTAGHQAGIAAARALHRR